MSITSHSSSRCEAPSRQTQRGTALLMGLIFTLAALLLALGAVLSVIYQQRIAASTRDRELAFQSAEAALRDAEMSIMCKVYTNANVLGLCVAGPDSPAAPACLPGCGDGSASQRFAVGFQPFDSSLCPFGICTTAAIAGTASETNKPVWEDVDWSAEKDAEPGADKSTVRIGYFTRHPGYASKSVVTGVTVQPRFLIEAPSNCDPKERYCTYRITAKGWGSKDSLVTLQEVFRPW